LKIAHSISNCNEKQNNIPFTAVYKPILMRKASLILYWIMLLHPAKSGIASFQSKEPIRPHNAMHSIQPSEKQGLTGRNMMGLCDKG
jgi:hypothetical protein